MIRKVRPQAAKLHSLSPPASATLDLINQFYEAVDEAFRELFGPQYRPNPRRHQIVRAVVTDNASGIVRTMSDYQDAIEAGHFGSREAIRIDIRFLESIGLVVLTTVPDRHKGTIVEASERLMEWYDDKLPRLLGNAFDLILAMRTTVNM